MAQQYTSAQIMAMQKDAIRRVNEMQRLSKQRVDEAKAEDMAAAVLPLKTAAPPIAGPIQTSQGGCMPQSVPNSLTGFLDRMGMDEEKILLLLLIVILINEGADMMLILALGYILL